MSEAPTNSSPFGTFERSMAWRYLRARREHGGAALISVISFVGIALAVTALIVIMSIMSGFRTTLLDTLLNGSGQVFVKVEQYQNAESEEIAKMIRGVEGVKSVHGIHQGQVLVSNGDRATGALVRGVELEDFELYKFREGRGSKEQFAASGYGEGKNGGNVIAMGVYVANELGVAPGMRVTLVAPNGVKTPFGIQPRKKEYIVGTVFQTGNAELDAAYIFMPREQAELFFSLPNGYTELDVRLEDPMAVTPAVAAISDATGNSLVIDNWQRRRAAYFNALQIERGMMRIVMLVLVAITALNIITGVVMLVKNKTRDIAILRTIGLSQGSVMRVFVMVGAVLGFTGALVGLLLGVAIVLNIGAVEAFLNFVIPGDGEIFDPETYGISGLPAELDWGEALFTTLWAVVMSVLVTIWPAWRAARLDPVEALRFE